MLGRKRLDCAGEIFRRRLRRASGDEGAGAAIGAGVVAAMRGVGLLQDDAIDRRRQRGRRDLAMHGEVPLPNSAVPTVSSKPPSSRSAMLRVGEMAGRRNRIDHGQRHALADQPVRRRGRASVPRLASRARPDRGTGRARSCHRPRRDIRTAAATAWGRRLARRCGGATRRGRCRAALPARRSPLPRRSASAAGRSRGTRPPARCWCRRRRASTFLFGQL